MMHHHTIKQTVNRSTDWQAYKYTSVLIASGGFGNFDKIGKNDRDLQRVHKFVKYATPAKKFTSLSW